MKKPDILPKISVVTICFNAEKTIRYAIESVLSQTYGNFEYVIIDGASTDGTWEIIKSFDDDRIVAFSETDGGISDAFNKGIRKSSGEIIGLLNADDRYCESALEIIAQEYMGLEPDVIYGDTIVQDKKNKLTIYKRAGDSETLKYEMPFIHQSSFVKKEAYDRFGGYKQDYKICMDYDMMARIYTQGGVFKCVHKPISFFCYGGTSCEHPFRTIDENIQINKWSGMNKYILIGKCYHTSRGGPAAIIRGLERELKRQNIRVNSLLLSEECGKIELIKGVLQHVLFSDNNVVNVHTEGFLIPLMVYFCSLLNSKNKYFLTVHGIYTIEADYTEHKKKRYVILEKFLYRHFGNIICVSGMLEQSLEKIFGRNKNVFVIPNATDATDFELYDQKVWHNEIKMIMLGGIRKQKGIYESLDLIDHLVNQKKMKIHFEIYGVTDSREEMEKFNIKLREKGLCDIVKYMGLIQNSRELYTLISDADFQLCMSHYDTFNVAVAESLVLGCPCICSDKCGAAYLIKEGINGTVVNIDKREYEKIFCFLNHVKDNMENYRYIIKEAENIRRLVSWTAVAKQYLRKTGYGIPGSGED